MNFSDLLVGIKAADALTTKMVYARCCRLFSNNDLETRTVRPNWLDQVVAFKSKRHEPDILSSSLAINGLPRPPSYPEKRKKDELQRAKRGIASIYLYDTNHQED